MLMLVCKIFNLHNKSFDNAQETLECERFFIFIFIFSLHVHVHVNQRKNHECEYLNI